MSSIPEKRIVESKAYFLRSSSLQKIKCTATYPFQLAGTKLSKDAIKELFETLIKKARVLSQKALLVLTVVILRFIGAVLPKKVKDGLVSDKIQKTDALLSFPERILEKIRKLQQHKKRSEVKSVKVEPKESPVAASEPVQSVESESTVKFRTEIESLRRVSSSSSSSTESESQLKPANQQRNRITLSALFVYASAIFTYLQLLFLTFALNTTRLPPGLVFMISSLLLIAVLLFKIFFMDKSKRKAIKKSKKSKLSSANKDSESNENSAPSTPTSETNTISSKCSSYRQSRQRTRTVLMEFNGKTLSKIKLL